VSVKSPVREFCTPGSVAGQLSNWLSYANSRMKIPGHAGIFGGSGGQLPVLRYRGHLLDDIKTLQCALEEIGSFVSEDKFGLLLLLTSCPHFYLFFLE
jgi:hypothetical protein